MSWRANVYVIIGVLSKQWDKRQTVTSHRLIIPTTWSMFVQTCRDFNPGMHVRFLCISTSSSASLGPECTPSDVKQTLKGEQCSVDNIWFVRRPKESHYDILINDTNSMSITTSKWWWMAPLPSDDLHAGLFLSEGCWSTIQGQDLPSKG